MLRLGQRLALLVVAGCGGVEADVEVLPTFPGVVDATRVGPAGSVVDDPGERGRELLADQLAAGPGWHFRAGPDGSWRVRDPILAADLAVGDGAARLEAGEAWSLQVRPTGVGRGSAATVRPGPSRAEGSRAAWDLEGDGVRAEAWVLTGPRGLEHGLTLTSAPDGDPEQPVVVEVALEGTLRVDATDPDRLALVDEAGRTWLYLGQLVVTDATGRVLPARLEATEGGYRVTLDDRDAAWPITVDPLITPYWPLLPSSGPVADDSFGRAVAVSGNRAAVGAYGDSSVANDAGAVWIFRWEDGAGWIPEQRVVANDASSGDAFGFSVALDGDRLVVGAYADDRPGGTVSGAAYVFQRSGTTWSQTKKLQANDAAQGDLFGYSVDLDGNRVIVGAPGADVGGRADAGAAYTYDVSSGTWTFIQKLISPSPNTWPSGVRGGQFGYDVALDGTWAAVGAPYEGSSGRAHAYSWSSTFWANDGAYLPPNNLSLVAYGSEFGTSVDITAVDGVRIMVGAPKAVFSVGGAVILRRDGPGTWNEEGVFVAQGYDWGDESGSAVAIDGDVAVMGSRYHPTGGRAEVFKRSGTSWSYLAGVVPTGLASGARYGSAVAVSRQAGADPVAVGAPYHQGKGGAWLFRLDETPTGTDVSFAIGELATGLVGTLSGSDLDGDALTWTVLDGDPTGAFTLDPTTGQLFVSSPSLLDHETTEAYELTVQVADPYGGTDTLIVSVKVEDQNEPPVASDLAVSVSEDATPGTALGTLSATDPDAGDAITWAIVPPDADALFVVDATSGQVTVAPGADLTGLGGQVVTLTVQASDADGLSDQAALTVTITSVNHPPVGVDLVVSVSENADEGDLVGTVQATDPDPGDTLTFDIISGNDGGAFTIDPDTGTITVAFEDAVEDATGFTLVVRVTDGDGAYDDVTVTISVIDGRANPVVIPAAFSIREDALVGAAVGTVTATDADNDPLDLSIVGGNPGGVFAIDDLGHLTVAAALDHETAPLWTLTVQAADPTGLTGQATVTVTVTNAAESPVVDDQAFTVSEVLPVDSLVGTVLASDPDVGDSVELSLLLAVPSGYLSLEGDGALRVTSPLDHEAAPTIVLEVLASDTTGRTDTATVTVTVRNEDEAPVVQAASFTIPEDAGVGDLVGPVSATDPEGDTVSCQVSAGDPARAFALGPLDHELRVGGPLDHEAKPSFSLQVACADPAGNVGTAVVLVNVTDVDEAPTAVDDAVTTIEDVAATFDVLANDVDPEEGVLLIAGWDATSSAGGAVSLTNGQLRYQPPAQFTGVDTFGYTATDGTFQDSATVTVTVSPIDDTPLLRMDPPYLDGAATFTAGGDPVLLAPNGTILDPDSATMTWMEARLEGMASSGEVLEAVGGLIAVSWDEPTGVLRFQGPGPRPAFVTALRSMTYANPDVATDLTPRSVVVTVSDGNTVSDPATVVIDLLPAEVTDLSDTPSDSDRPTDTGASDLPSDGVSTDTGFTDAITEPPTDVSEPPTDAPFDTGVSDTEVTEPPTDTDASDTEPPTDVSDTETDVSDTERPTDGPSDTGGIVLPTDVSDATDTGLTDVATEPTVDTASDQPTDAPTEPPTDTPDPTDTASDADTEPPLDDTGLTDTGETDTDRPLTDTASDADTELSDTDLSDTGSDVPVEPTDSETDGPGPNEREPTEVALTGRGGGGCRCDGVGGATGGLPVLLGLGLVGRRRRRR